MSTVKTVDDALINVSDLLKQNIIETYKEKSDDIKSCSAELQKLNEIYECINSSDTLSVLEEAQNDLLNSVLFACQGFYRNAHICLRSALELTLSFVYYYDHYYDFVLWKADCLDMTWSKLTSTECGVFNSKFYGILLNDSVKNLDFEMLISETQKIYHLSSQSVHGKYEYMQTKLSHDNKYNKDTFNVYYELFKSVINLVKSILYIRFYKEIHTNLDNDDIRNLNIIIKKYEVLR